MMKILEKADIKQAEQDLILDAPRLASKFSVDKVKIKKEKKKRRSTPEEDEVKKDDQKDD